MSDLVNGFVDYFITPDIVVGWAILKGHDGRLKIRCYINKTVVGEGETGQPRPGMDNDCGFRLKLSRSIEASELLQKKVQVCAVDRGGREHELPVWEGLSSALRSGEKSSEVAPSANRHATAIEKAKLFEELVQHRTPSGLPILDALFELDLSRQDIGEIEIWLEKIRDQYPDDAGIGLSWVFLPAKKNEWFESGRRAMSLVKKFPGASPAYIQGIYWTVLSADYDTQRVLLDAVTQNYSKWEDPAHLFGLLGSVLCAGGHPIVAPLFDLVLRRCPERLPAHIIQRCTQHLNNKADVGLSRVKLISLGENCFPWLRLNFWGLRHAPHLPEVQSPFNMVALGLAGPVPIMADDFSLLLNAAEFTTITDAAGTAMPYHKRYGIWFNHECGRFGADKGFSEIVDLYRERIQFFRENAFAGPRVYVLYWERTRSIEGLEELIRNRSTDDLYRLVVIDVRNRGAGQSLWRPQDPRTVYAPMVLPWAGYAFFRHEDRNSLQGVEFEARIEEIVRKAMLSIEPPPQG